MPLPPTPQTCTSTPADQFRLLWSDEFTGAAGAPPDPAIWSYEIGGQGWGNHEWQYYTDLPTNAALDGQSNLIITARPITESQPPQCWYGPCRFTSARLVTQQHFVFTYGLIEARIRLPFGQGIWPALWMLGENFSDKGWPECGEIDIMENIGKEPGIVHGTVHGPGYCGANGIGSQLSLPPGRQLATDFHLFAVDWQPGSLRWYIDNQLYFTLTPAQLPPNTAWVFDHPFFLLLNLAVGGDWPGYPDATTTFPQTLQIDYVRVFQRC